MWEGGYWEAMPEIAARFDLPIRIAPADIDELGHVNNVVYVRWVQDAVQQRRVRCTRIGKHVRFTAEHLAELIASGEQAVLSTVQAGAVTPFRDGRRSRL